MFEKPIDNIEQDQFCRAKFAKQIATLCKEKRSDSAVIGLYGKWGEGKTSLLNLVSKSLEEEILQVHYNPWYFKDDEALLNAFFKKLADSLGRKLTTKTRQINNLFADYGEALGVLEIVGMPSVFSKLTKLVKRKEKDSVETTKGNIIRFIEESNLNIVIFIDDLDRLQEREVAAMFRLVKLLADFPRTTYILTFDPAVVSPMLNAHLGQTRPEAGLHYLEKIIQLPISIPKIREEELMNFFGTELQATSASKKEGWLTQPTPLQEVWLDGLSILLNNPRKVVRFKNTIQFIYPLLEGEINIRDLLVVEAIRAETLELYNFLRNNAEVFLQDYFDKDNITYTDNRAEVINRTKEVLKIYPQEISECVMQLISNLFPRFAWNNEQDLQAQNNPQWNMERRICSRDYFNRYFALNIRSTDIPDTSFHHYYLQASMHTLEALEKQFREDCSIYGQEKLALKMAMFRHQFKPEAATELIKTIARSSDLLQEPLGPDFGSPFLLMSLSVMDLLKSLAEQERFVLADKAIQESTIEFAAELLSRMVTPKSEENQETFFKGQEALNLINSFINRIRDQVDEKGLFATIPEEKMARQLWWWLAVDEMDIKNRIQQLIVTDSTTSLKLLRAFTPTTYSISSATNRLISFKSDFNEEQYLQLTRLVPETMLYANLILKYGFPSINEPIESIAPNDPMDDKMMIAKFQYLFMLNTGGLGAGVQNHRE